MCAAGDVEMVREVGMKELGAKPSVREMSVPIGTGSAMPSPVMYSCHERARPSAR